MNVEELIEKLQKCNPKAKVCKRFLFDYVPIDTVHEVINGEYMNELEEPIKSDLVVLT